jgi:hypothetical protein
LQCAFCFRLGYSCIAESSRCVELQKASACHACDLAGCWSTRPDCAYQRKGYRKRPLESDARTDGQAAPNLFRRRRAVIRIMPTETLVELDGKVFFKGSASGTGCNCLIDSLRQCIAMQVPFVADSVWIRRQLLGKFPRAGANAVNPLSYLDLFAHWEDVVRLLGEQARAMGCDAAGVIKADSFRIVCVEESSQLVGEEYGRGPRVLYLMNESFRHFVPLIEKMSTRSWSGASASSSSVGDLGRDGVSRARGAEPS